MPSAPSGALKKFDDFAHKKTLSAVVPKSFGPAIPGLFVYPQELTEMMGPLPAAISIGCTQGPPDDPPESPQLGSHQLTAPSVAMSSAQYLNCGSTLYE